MRFDEKLMELRRANALSQEELGEKLGVTRQTVSKWETAQTTPEMDKLVEMSRLFGVSIDELVGLTGQTGQASRDGGERAGAYASEQYNVTGGTVAPVMQYIALPRAFHYEYKSKREWLGMPLVHINVGFRMRKARGVFAVGGIASGIVTVGAISLGVVSFGALSAGVVAFGAAALGLFAFGGFALGALAIGGIALGLVAIGGLASGVYAIGGLATATRIAMGGVARGHIAIGEMARGQYVWGKTSELTKEDFGAIRAVILQEYPGIWDWVVRLFSLGF